MWWRNKKPDAVLDTKTLETEETKRIGFPLCPDISDANITTQRLQVTRSKKRKWRKDKKYVEERYLVTVNFTMKKGNGYGMRWLSHSGSREAAINECVNIASKRIRQSENPQQFLTKTRP